jgi:hypothetical protein
MYFPCDGFRSGIYDVFHDNELGKQLSALYQKRKNQLHDAIVNKQVNNKINFFNDKCVGGKNKSKMFWNMLKGPRVTINPSQIILLT